MDRLILLVFCCICFCQFASSQNAATKPTIEKIELLVDDSQKLTIDDVKNAKGFREIKNGYTIPNKITNNWFKITIHQNSISSSNYLICLKNALHFDLQFFQYSHGCWSSKICGINNQKKNSISNEFSIFKLNFNSSKNNIVFLKNKSLGSTEKFNFDVQEINNYNSNLQNLKFQYGIFYGVLGLIFFINIFYYFTIKEKAFAFYSVYILFTILFFLCVDNLPFFGLLNSIFTGYFIELIFLVILNYFGFLPLFTIHYVQLRDNKKILKFSVGFYLFSLVIGISLLVIRNSEYNAFSYLVHNITILFSYLFTLYLAIRGRKNNRILSRTFLVAMGIMIVAIIISTLESYGMTEFSMYFDLMKLASLLEITILSFALALYFKNLKQDLSVKSVELDSLSHDYEEKEKEYSSLEDRFLSNQMNPHFTFNAMNSIQQYILENEPMKAQNYLTKYSKLIRKVLENTMEPYVSLEDEIQLLQLYLEIERMRFKFPFEIEINVDEELQNRSDLSVPPMIVQPYIENALWHGLLHKTDASGKISLNFSMVENWIKCVIEDNGPGREYTRRLPKEAKEHRSVGMLITQKRLEHLHRSTALEVSHEIIDLQDDQGNPRGTRVEILLPLKK